MPATAGRVRMPANNRVHSSAALQTHGIWQSAIGYDPYAPASDKSKGSKPDKAPDSNAYASFRDLLTLARITNTNTNETRGACKKCGRVGHLTFQCRNFLSLKDDRPPVEAATAEETAKAIFEKIKKKDEIKSESESEVDEDDEEEISSSDSDVDPEMERIIAERFGRPMSKKAETLIKKSKKKSNSSDDGEEEERRKKRKHRHHRRRRQRKSDEDSDSDRHRRHKRRGRRVRESDSDSSSGSESDRRRNQRRRRHKDRRSVLSSGSESTGSSSDDDERRERRRKKRSRGHKED